MCIRDRFDIVKNPLEARKHLGYLPEHVPLYDDQRVTEYLKCRARLKGISSKQIWPAVSKAVSYTHPRYLRSKTGLGHGPL